MNIRLLEKIYFTREHLYLVFEGDVEFEAGHALGIEREGVKRYYSVASAPSDGVITFVVHLIPGGRMSGIFERAEPGDEWKVVDVVGKFSLDLLKGKTAVLSAGTGIAPFRSLYREALHRGMELDVIHLHSARYLHHVPFLGEWEKYGVKFVPTITRDPNYPGERGRIDGEKVKKYVPDHGERTFLVCGPSAFVGDMVRLLSSLGVKKFVVEGW